MKSHGNLDCPIWLLSFGMVVLFSASLPSCLVDEDQNYLEARKAWRTYLTKLGSVKGTIKSTLKTDGSNLVSSNTVEITYGRDTRHQKTVLTSSLGKSTATSTNAYVKNPRYAFSVGKPVGTEGWGLTGMAFNATGNDESKSFVQTIDKKVMHLQQLFSVTKTTLENLAVQPNFRIVATKSIEEKGKKLIQVEFTNIHPLEKAETNVQRGILLLDPNACWCIANGEVESLYSDGTQLDIISNDYETAADGVPVPLRTTHRYKVVEGESKGKESLAEINSNIQRLKVPASDAEFTLSAFGLPEPESNFRFPISLSVALAIFGIAIFSIGLYFRNKGQP